MRQCVRCLKDVSIKALELDIAGREVWPFQDYSKSFVFDVAGNQISADE